MKVKVFNYNYDERTGKGYVFKQNFRGRDLVIEPNNFIIMEDDEANDFLGMFSPVKKDANGNDLPAFFKKLRIETIAEEVTKKVPKLNTTYNCNVCSYKAASAEELQLHCDTTHIEQLADVSSQDAARARVQKMLESLKNK